MEAPGVYIREIDISSGMAFGDDWKQQYLKDWWMNRQNTKTEWIYYREKSDWNEVDKLFKEEL